MSAGEGLQIECRPEIITSDNGDITEYINLSIPGVGYAELAYDLDDADILTLNDIHILEGFQGNKYSSALFKKAVEIGRSKEFKYLSANVGNERIARCFRNSFSDDEVEVESVDPEVLRQYGEPGAAALSLQAIEKYLGDRRAIEQPDSETGLLETMVTVTAKL